MREHPERMILIAVIAALVVAIIGSVAMCGAMTSAMGQLGYSSNDLLLGDGGNGGDKPDYGNGQDGNGEDGVADETPLGGNDDYTESDVPAEMDIDVPELQDDLQACINNDLVMRLDSFDTIEITELTKDSVAKPQLKAGRVLSSATGKATVKTMDGTTETIGYTSYYYAADPTAQKITWYIYAYDLDSYSLFPDGFQGVAGDPMGVRDIVDSGIPASDSQLGRDTEGSRQAA